VDSEQGHRVGMLGVACAAEIEASDDLMEARSILQLLGKDSSATAAHH
jgi:hypothetical protein